MPELHVTVGADIDGTLVAAKADSFVIPPGYTQADIDALAVRSIEDTAFDAVREAYGRQPTRRALLAAAARLTALRGILDRMPRTNAVVEHVDHIQAVFDLTNDEAIAQYGDDPEGG